MRFEHPLQRELFTLLLEQLVAESRKVVAVMEPTGTYGDAVKYQLMRPLLDLTLDGEVARDNQPEGGDVVEV